MDNVPNLKWDFDPNENLLSLHWRVDPSVKAQTVAFGDVSQRARGLLDAEAAVVERRTAIAAHAEAVRTVKRLERAVKQTELDHESALDAKPTAAQLTKVKEAAAAIVQARAGLADAQGGLVSFQQRAEAAERKIRYLCNLAVQEAASELSRDLKNQIAEHVDAVRKCFKDHMKAALADWLVGARAEQMLAEADRDVRAIGEDLAKELLESDAATKQAAA
jgi:hypothetical protein